MEIRIDRGYKSYDVTDADGTVLGTVRLNLADAGLIWYRMPGSMPTLTL